MPLDPQAQRVIDAMAALNLKPVEESTPAEARESIRARTAALGPFPDVAAVVDHRVPVAGGEITVRAYSPGGPGPHPALVYYHGGGWVIGDLHTHDGLCRSLTNAGRSKSQCSAPNSPQCSHSSARTSSERTPTWRKLGATNGLRSSR